MPIQKKVWKLIEYTMCVYVCVYIYYTYTLIHIPTPLHEQDVTQGQFEADINRFSFSYIGCHTKVEEHRLLCPIIYP